MPFERPSLQTIQNRIEKGIESRLFGKTALLRRAVLRILARVFAGAIHTCYGYILDVVTQLFITTATGKFLDRLGIENKVFRKAGSFSTGEGDFTGTIGFTLPKDTRIQNEEGIEFGTVIETLFTSTIHTIDIQAVESGIASNIEVTTPIEFQMVSPISGFEDVIDINNSITGGIDQENDEDYRKRILYKKNFPPMGGKKEDYIVWTNEVDGVDQSWCYHLAFGPGTVAVVITAKVANPGDDPTPSALLLSDVYAYVSDKKPIGATLSVLSITDDSGVAGTAKVDYDISINPNLPEVQQQIRTNLIDLYYPLEPGSIILISQVRGALNAAGLTDYEITSFSVDGVSKPIADYDLNGFAYPVIQNLTFVTKT